MKRLFYIVGFVAIAISVTLLMRPMPLKVEVATVSKGSFDETLITDGKIRAKTKQTLYAFASGNIENLKVKVGDHVEKNQVLSKLVWDYDRPLKSPFTGVVSKIYRDSAGPIMRGEPIVEISQLTDLEVVADLLTTDAVRLQKGGKAHILNWGMDTPLEAEITVISHAGVVKMSALGVDEERTDVRLKLLRVPQEIQGKLGDTYHVDVAFLVSHADEVIKVPLGALFKTGETWAVYIIDGDKARLRNIQVAKKNDKEIVVTQGLAVGEKVILFPGDKIHEGTRVQ